MIKFEVAKLRAVYVNIVKVTTDYVYVTTHRNGEKFEPKGCQTGTYNKMEVSKIKLHRSVSHGFFKYNVMKEFNIPRLATLNYYGSDIISIEIQMYNHRLKGFQEAANWKSNFSKVIQDLEQELSKVSEAWINGQEIFWLDLNEDGTKRSLSISVDNSIQIHAVKFIRLARIGLNVLQRENTKTELDATNSESGELLEDINNKAQLIISVGRVLGYYPNINHSEAEQITVYSPVLRGESVGAAKTYEKAGEVSEEKKVYSLNSSDNPCYPSIEFVLRAAKTIGKLYGHEETEFLNIPAIIAKTGEVNFYNIEEGSRKSTPIDMSAIDALAWLFGFIYREDKINNMRELSSMFRFIINKGLVFKGDIINPFLDNAPSKSIPLTNLKYINNKVVVDEFFYSDRTLKEQQLKVNFN